MAGRRGKTSQKTSAEASFSSFCGHYETCDVSRFVHVQIYICGVLYTFYIICVFYFACAMHNVGNLTCDIKFLRVFFARYGFEWVRTGASYGCHLKLNIWFYFSEIIFLVW